MVDLVEESVTECHHSRKLDFGDLLGCVALVTTDGFVFIVVPEDGALAVRVAVVECVAVAARVLGVIGLDDFAPADTVRNTIFLLLDDGVTHRHRMV